MPVLKFDIEFFSQAMKPLSIDEARDLLFKLKCETDILDTGEIEVEVNPDRPDMYSIEGIRRAVFGLAGLQTGWRRPLSRDSGLELVVGLVESRPYIAAAVVYNINIKDTNYLKQLIQFQEKLHDTIGRRRRKVAIGFHDLEKLPGKRLEYKQLNINNTRFVPLSENIERTASWVITNTEQGRKYGAISLSESGGHPFLLAGEKVIAMPPVINSEITRVDIGTKHLFIDVTGTSREYVEKVLDIIVSNLSENENTIVGKVKTIYLYESRTIYYPRLQETRAKLELDYAREILGFYITASNARRALEAMRYNVIKSSEGSPRAVVEVLIPPFRVDYISPVDFVEDIAIAIGYENLYPTMRPITTRGYFREETKLFRAIRELLVGLGFTEVLQLMLTSPDMARLSSRDFVEIRNPIQYEYSVLRPDIVVSLLQVLRENQHVKKPIRIFEIGEVVYRVGDRIKEESEIGIAVMSDETSIEDIQAPLYALLRALEVPFVASEGCTRGVMLRGRCGTLTGPDSGVIAEYGEVDPIVLEKLSIEYPIALAVVSAGEVLKWRFKTRGQH